VRKPVTMLRVMALRFAPRIQDAALGDCALDLVAELVETNELLVAWQLLGDDHL